MPPLWIEHSVWLASKKLILASQPRLQKADKQWTSATIDAQSAALALQQRLETRPKSSISTLNILLSGDWVRYAVLPWQDGLYQPDDWNAYARLILAQQFAGSAEGWRLCINPAGFGEPRMVAAMDESIYQVIIELTRTNKLRLNKMQPLFSAVHQLYRKQLKAAEFALVISEADQLCCGFWRDGAWQGVISLPQNQDSEALLNGGMAALLRQAAMLAQVSLPPQIYISSSAHPLAKLSLPECEVSYLGAVHPLFAGDWAL
ncbi:hypothetical protein WAE56_14980 [Iodobacter sp. LRB]|uniref:hypothetical protein n=1 Tax=unclassified Iodobacter TaxID=235634 RepID=UPI000C0D2935|nr:hypothetical protein [Iodobacter sp. BJB302]PHV00622.1 hypothetical protein CSQ88_16375 [Iodobacter sp. BJB302]